jgi:hypothetical protein
LGVVTLSPLDFTQQFSFGIVFAAAATLWLTARLIDRIEFA